MDETPWKAAGQGVSGEAELGVVSNTLFLVAPCCAREGKTLNSLSKQSKSGMVSNVGFCCFFFFSFELENSEFLEKSEFVGFGLGGGFFCANGLY